MKLAGLELKAKTGINECTTTTQFFDVTSIVKKLPPMYTKVFLVDQPGKVIFVVILLIIVELQVSTN